MKAILWFKPLNLAVQQTFEPSRFAGAWRYDPNLKAGYLARALELEESIMRLWTARRLFSAFTGFLLAQFFPTFDDRPLRRRH